MMTRFITTVHFARVVFIFLLTNSVEGGSASLTKISDLPKANKAEEQRQRKNSKEKSCMILASCHLAREDVYRSRGLIYNPNPNHEYEYEYNQARHYIDKHKKWIECGIKRINEKCALLTPTCWDILKQHTVNGIDELSFANRCGGETLPYMYNLCSRKVPWPNDIQKSMSDYYPGYCTTACSAFRQFNRYHRRYNVTKFPAGWIEGVGSVGLDDRDGMDWTNRMVMEARRFGFIKEGLVQTANLPPPAMPPTTTTKPMDRNTVCNFFNNCTTRTKTTAEKNAEVDREDDMRTPKMMRLKKEKEKCNGDPECVKNLFPIPSFPPINVYKDFNYAIKDTINTLVIQTQISACRAGSWVRVIYADFPNSVFGLCYDEKRVLKNSHIWFASTFDGTPKSQGWKNCDQGVNGISSYIAGAVFHLNSNGWIEKADWICSGAIKNAPEVNNDQTKTLRCPNEMLLCAITTNVMRFGSVYRIVNVKLGCCDVPSSMHYSATNFNALPPWPQHQVKYVTPNDALLISKSPETKLCPPNTFISHMEVTLHAYTKRGSKDRYPLLSLDFKCSNYRAFSRTSTSISKGLYKTSGAELHGQAVVECPRGSYAFGLYIGSSITSLLVGPTKLWCSNNTHNTMRENKTELGLSLGQFQPARKSNMFCPKEQALCGFIVTLGNTGSQSHTHISGYQYEFICCPIPVRNIVEQECQATGVQFIFEEDTERRKSCDRGCGDKELDLAIGDVVALSPDSTTTGHYPTYVEELHKAIITATNVHAGVNYSDHFEVTDHLMYGDSYEYDILDESNIQALEARQAKFSEYLLYGFLVHENAIIFEIFALLSAIVPGAQVLSGFHLGAEGVLRLSSYGLDQYEPYRLDAISNQLISIENEIKASNLYLQVIKKNKKLKLIARGKDFPNDDNPKPFVYRYVAKCGKAIYNLGYNEMFHYDRWGCPFNSFPRDEFEPTPYRLLNNSKGTTNITFTIRFNQVGTMLDSEQPHEFSHWIKLEKLMERTAKAAFGRRVRGIGRFYGNQTYLFQRPNRTKFYFAEITVPPGMYGNICQLVASCGRWRLYTKTLHIQFSKNPEEFGRKGKEFAFTVTLDAHE